MPMRRSLSYAVSEAGVNESEVKQHMIELRKNVTAETLERAYSELIKQANENAVTGKSNGCRTPYGFHGNADFDGATFSQHFGQGAASKTPYISWWVVSIYYVADSGKIYLGIEEDRYPYLNKMTPVKYKKIGNKSIRIAVFFESSVESVDYGALYECFIGVSEEVMKLGLGNRR